MNTLLSEKTIRVKYRFRDTQSIYSKITKEYQRYGESVKLRKSLLNIFFVNLIFYNFLLFSYDKKIIHSLFPQGTIGKSTFSIIGVSINPNIQRLSGQHS